MADERDVVPAAPVPGCEACERRFPTDRDEAYVRTLGPDALEHLHPPLVEVQVDGYFVLCPAHRDALLAIVGPPINSRDDT